MEGQKVKDPDGGSSGVPAELGALGRIAVRLDWIATACAAVRPAETVALRGIARELRECTLVGGYADHELRELADSAQVLLWMTGPDSLCTFLNQGWRKFTGRTLEQDLGVGWAEGVHPEDLQRCLEAYMAAFSAQRTFEIIYRLRRHDGQYRWILDHGAPRHAADGAFAGYIGSCIDITEIRAAEEERDRLRTQMLHSQKLESIGVLAGGIAHDFNNLLTGILGNANLALVDLAPDHPLVGRLQGVIQAAERAAVLTRQILAYSGRAACQILPVDLGQQIREISSLLATSLSKRVHLDLGLATDLPTVEADLAQLQQVVMNLVINANEAIGDRSGTISVRTGRTQVAAGEAWEVVPTEGLAPGEYAFFEVRDDGVGMDAETRRRIFEPFFSTKFTGRGLGLAAVSGIVRSHRGALKVESQPGVGTTFRVLFRLSGKPMRPLAAPPTMPSPDRRGRILVVDDEAIVRDLIQSGLQSSGYQVVTAADGRQALDAFRRQQPPFDLVLLDLTMPVMGGEETMVELKRLDPNVVVLLTSGFNELEATRRFATRGLAGFLQKPFTVQTLIGKMTSHLGVRTA